MAGELLSREQIMMDNAEQRVNRERERSLYATTEELECE